MLQFALEEIVEAPPDDGAAPSDAQRNRLAAALLRTLRHGTNRAFRRYAELAPTVTSPLLEMTLAWCATSCDPKVARRARYALSLIDASVLGRHDDDGSSAKGKPGRAHFLRPARGAI